MGEDQSELPPQAPQKKIVPLPGGPATVRPIEMNGKLYDPFDPPKLVRAESGEESFIGGKELDKDQVYADKFWNRYASEEKLTNNLRNTMSEIIHKAAANEGTMGCFVNPSGITEEDKERLSAYRQLAKELGYEVGEYKFNKNTYAANATITKKTS